MVDSMTTELPRLWTLEEQVMRLSGDVEGGATLYCHAYNETTKRLFSYFLNCYMKCK